MGLRKVVPNLRTVAYVEIEAFACANLVTKMEAGMLDAAPIWTDVKTFPCDVFRDRVHIISGGYPCQPFSAAGRRKGEDDPRHLWPHIRKIVRAIRPVQCFFENVEGHISLGLKTVISDLVEDGYNTTWGIFSAEEVGAPHRRKRVFILANDQRERVEEQSGEIPVTSKYPPPLGLRYWPTIAAHEARLGFQNRNNGMKGSQKSLTTVVVEDGQAAPESLNTDGNHLEFWPQVCAASANQGMNAPDGRRAQTLIGAARGQKWATPSTRDGHNHSNPSGLKRKSPDLSRQQPPGGKLNPRWVETLMGLPVGWTMPSCTNPVTVE